jgi:hypothetical protein
MSLWIDPAQPVNYNSPLNRGLVSWWLAGPNACGFGSGIWRDLAKRNNGTLTNGPTWSGQSHPGGWGSLSFDGTDDAATTPAVVIGATGTIVAWVNRRGDGPGLEIFWSHGADSSDTRLRFDADAGAFSVSLGSTWNGQATGDSFTSGEWAHVAMTWVATGGAAFVYWNGKETLTTAVSHAFPSTQVLTFGDYGAGGGHEFNGYLDGLQFYNRALSASEVSALYQESLAGHPTTLNWLRPRIYFDAGGAPAGGAFSIFDSPIITAAA